MIPIIRDEISLCIRRTLFAGPNEQLFASTFSARTKFWQPTLYLEKNGSFLANSNGKQREFLRSGGSALSNVLVQHCAAFLELAVGMQIEMNFFKLNINLAIDQVNTFHFSFHKQTRIMGYNLAHHNPQHIRNDIMPFGCLLLIVPPRQNVSDSSWRNEEFVLNRRLTYRVNTLKQKANTNTNTCAYSSIQYQMLYTGTNIVTRERL